MNKNIITIETGIDTSQMLEELNEHPELWDLYPQRRKPEGSPHAAMTDIWLRFADINAYAPTEYRKMSDEHDSQWYEAIDSLPSVKAFCHILMGQLEGERLGGVLIAKLPAGKAIGPHTDSDWHSQYYKKFHLILQGEGTVIYAGDEHHTAEDGDLFYLNDKVTHGVINNGDEDRIALIVCIKQDSGFRVRKV